MDTKASLLAMKEDIGSLTFATKEAIADFKRSLIKWMFILWITQIILYGLVLLLLKK